MKQPRQFSDLQSRILDRIQHEFPLSEDPYGDLAAEFAGDIACTREAVHAAVQALRKDGIIRRIGGSFVPGKLGYVSVLVAGRVDADKIEQAAARAAAYPEVTHNYEREGTYNLWFTVIGESQGRIDEILDDVRSCEGVHGVYPLPALSTFKIRVEFDFGGEASDD